MFTGKADRRLTLIKGLPMKHLSISLLITLFALSSHAPAAAAETTNYNTAWTFVVDSTGRRVAMYSGTVSNIILLPCLEKHE